MSILVNLRIGEVLRLGEKDELLPRCEDSSADGLTVILSLNKRDYSNSNN